MKLWRGPSAGVLGLTMVAVLWGAPALAADSEIVISQESAMAGNVTPGDEPGFPVTISAPGHYRLAGSLTPGAGTDGIVIKADNVTLDLAGFALAGAHSETGIASYNDAVEIRNGVITGFDLFAIDTHTVGRFWTIANMRIVQNGMGVWPPGPMPVSSTTTSRPTGITG